MKLKISLLSFLYFFTFSINSEPSFVYSHSLNGNLIACTCTLVPIAGLSRRYSFLETNQFYKEDTIFLELGNFFSPSDSIEKRKAILEVFTNQKNIYLFLGKNELQTLGVSFWKEISVEKILLLNLKEKKIFGSSELFTPKVVLNLNQKKILLSSVISKHSFQTLPESFQNEYKFLPVLEQVQTLIKETSFDLLVLGILGKANEFHELSLVLPKNTLLFLVPFESVNAKNGYIQDEKLGRLYTTSGKNGDELGFLELQNFLSSKGKVKTFTLIAEDWKDNPKILEIAKKWKVPVSP
jgi:hypothetical protein